MKARITFSILALLLLNSCIVKSLFPFYTKDTIHFEKAFLGIWNDEKETNSKWMIFSLNEIALKEKKKDSTQTGDDKIQKEYKDGYYVVYSEKNTKSLFLAMPFKINNQLFLDFTPLYYDTDNMLIDYHLVPAHSLVKFDIINDNTVNIKWLSSKKIGNLIDQNKIKIKHERFGTEKDNYLLTASSEELQKFIKKYMSSKDNEKWKTDVQFNLKKEDSTEEYQKLIEAIVNGDFFDKIPTN